MSNKTGPILRPISSKKDHGGFFALDYLIIDINCPTCGEAFWFAKLSNAEENEIKKQRHVFTQYLSEHCPNHIGEIRWDDINNE